MFKAMRPLNFVLFLLWVSSAFSAEVQGTHFVAPEIKNPNANIPNPSIGEIVIDSDDSTFKGFNGVTFAPLGGGSGGASALYLGTFTGGNSSNYWTVSSTAYADFTLNGSLTLSQQYNYNMGTVSAAGSGYPGISFTAPVTGTIEVDVNIGGCYATANNSSVAITDGSNTVLNEQSWHNNGANETIGGSIQAFVDVTASTAYTFKIRAKSSSGSVICAGSTGVLSPISMAVKYLK